MTWEIPALRGFPGAYMHPVNDWFTAGDWLRLMHGIADRRIIFTPKHCLSRRPRSVFSFDQTGILPTGSLRRRQNTNSP